MARDRRKTLYKFKLLVRESSFRRFNLFLLPVIFLIAMVLNFKNMLAFLILLSLFAATLVYAIKILIELKKNLKAWDKGMPNYVELYIDTNTGKIGTNGIEFNAIDVSEVRFKVQQKPVQTGITAVLLNAFFLNTCIEFDLGNNNVISVPIQDKGEIKDIIDLLSDLDVKTRFDIEIYKWCNVR